MNTTAAFTIGTKFASQNCPDFIRTIVEITDTRVIYNDGQKHYTSTGNKKQLNSWFTIKGFEKRLKEGGIFIV